MGLSRIAKHREATENPGNYVQLSIKMKIHGATICSVLSRIKKVASPY